MGNDMIVSLCKIYELNNFCAFFFRWLLFLTFKDLVNRHYANCVHLIIHADIKVDFHCLARFLLRTLTHVNFNHVNKTEAR